MPSPSLPTHRNTPRLGACLVVALPLWLAGCATSSPVVDPGVSASGASARSQQDVKECSAQADRAVGRNSLSADKTAKAAGKTAGVAFAATAVGSLVAKSNDVWDRARGAAAGGAAGMASKLILEWNEGDEVYRKYVERCLDRRGHDVLGWR